MRLLSLILLTVMHFAEQVQQEVASTAKKQDHTYGSLS